MGNKRDKSITLYLQAALLEEVGIPERFWNLGVESYYGPEHPMGRMLNYISRLKTARDRAMGLFFTGPTSSFKTFFVCHILKVAVATPPYTSQYCSFDKLLGVYLGKGQIDFHSFATSADFFGLDNIESPHHALQAKALAIFLRARIDANLPTILASQLDSVGIQNFYKSRVSEMLADAFVEVKCTTDEFKKRAMIEKNKKGF